MIAHKRIRIQNGKIEEAPRKSGGKLNYGAPYSKANKFTDIRALDLPSNSIIRSELLIGKNKTVPQFLADQVKKNPGTFWVVVQASYFNSTNGDLLGKTIKDGKVIFPDVHGKTEQRPHLYSRGGVIGIGRVDNPAGIDWAVCIVPTLTHGGFKVYPKIDEKLQNDMTTANPRIEFGIKKDGTLGIVLVDGRGNVDYGMDANDSESMMYSLGYVNSGIGDSGGSATLATNCKELQESLEMKQSYHVSDMSQKTPRAVHHAIAIQINPNVLFPKKLTAEEYIEQYLKPVVGKVKFTETHVHHTWLPNIKGWRGSTDPSAIIDGMRNYHINTRGFQDIAQHVTIDPDGFVWPGRDLLTPPASATNHNDSDDDGQHPFMYEMIGDFDEGKEKLEEKQLAAVIKLHRAIRVMWKHGDSQTKFHRDMTNQKSCPGTGITKEWFLSQVKEVRPVKKQFPAVQDFIPVDGELGIVYEGLLINGLTYLPIRELGEALNAEIGWDPVKRRASIKGNYFS